MTEPNTAPPGYYRHPVTGAETWWDGMRWHDQAPPPPPRSVPQPVAGLAGSGSTQRSSRLLVVGTVLVLLLLAIVALAVRSPQQSDDVMASTSTSAGPEPRPTSSAAHGGPSEVDLPIQEWTCNDPESDLHSEPVGEPFEPIPFVQRSWVEVTSLSITRVGTSLVVVWELAGAIPADIGASPSYGAWLASWSVEFRSVDLIDSTLIAIDKEGELEPTVLVEHFDMNTREANRPYGADEVDLIIDGSLITITLPAEAIDRAGRSPLVTAASEFRSVQGASDNGDFFAGWFYEDRVCSTSDPEEWGRWATS